MRIASLAAVAAAAALAGCAGYENTAQKSAIGAAAGAATGAAVAGDAETGALVGAAVGAAGGAAIGCRQDGKCPWSRTNERHSDLRYDRQAQRYYYVNRGDGCTYWENGQYRAC